LENSSQPIFQLILKKQKPTQHNHKHTKIHDTKPKLNNNTKKTQNLKLNEKSAVKAAHMCTHMCAQLLYTTHF